MSIYDIKLQNMLLINELKVLKKRKNVENLYIEFTKKV